ncbi:MAG: hypothetical protein V4719_02530 [Planctomycetota bacterium]
MAEHRITSNWPLCIVAMILMYPLSFGPVSHLVYKGYLPRALWSVYQPVIRVTRVTPQPIRKWTQSYHGWWLFGHSA